MDKKTRRGNRDPTMHPTKGLQEAAKRQHPDADVGDTFLPLTGEVLAGFAHWASPRRGTTKRGVSRHRDDRITLH